MWSNRLSAKEANRTKNAIADLSNVTWAEPLLSHLKKAGGINSENMPLMFEVHFAHELYRAGITAEYEYSAGVGDSTIEFRLKTNPEWLIELVSVRTSDAAKRAIQKAGLIYEQIIRPTPEDPGRSVEGEMITAEQKIGEKVFTNGKPTKFPELDNTVRLILTDIRGYLDEGGDVFDYRQMAYGARGIPLDYSWAIHYWESEPGRLSPIKGLFETDNPLRSAKYIQERIHFLGFVRERDFYEDEIKTIGFYLANWHLFKSNEEANSIYETFPLGQKAS